MSSPTRYGAGDHEQNNQNAPQGEFQGWKPFRPSENGPESRVKSDYGYGRLAPPQASQAMRDQAAVQPMREERSFWSRTRDEVRSWFGDRDAEARRTADVARSHGFESGTRDPHDDEDDVVWHGDENLPPPQ